MSETALRFEGVEIEIGPKKYVLPPLSFKQLRQYGPLLKEYGGKTQEELMKSVSLYDILRITPIEQAALARNYPEITLDEIEENLGIESAADGTLLNMVTALFGVSGVKAQALGEAKAVGS